MLSTLHSDIFTTKVATSSSGAFQNVSGMRWNPEQFSVTEGANVFSGLRHWMVELEWREESTDMAFSHTFRIEKGQGPIQQEVFLRILAHILVNRVPDIGLPELLEALQDMREFYEEKLNFHLEAGQLPEKRVIKETPVRLEAPITRPELYAED